MSTQDQSGIFKNKFLPYAESGIALGTLAWIYWNTWCIGGAYPGSLSYNFFVLSILLTGQLLLQLYKKQNEPLRVSFLSLGLGVFSVWVCISAYTVTPILYLGRLELFLILQAFFFSYLLGNILQDIKLKLLFVYGMVFLLVFQVLISIYQYYYSPYWLPFGLKLPVYSGRSSGSFGSPNHFAALLSLGFFPCLMGVWNANLNLAKRLLCLFLIFLLSFGLALAFSRGAFLGIIFGLFFLSIWIVRVTKHTYKLLALVGFVVLLIALLALSFAKARFNFALQEGIDTSRIAFWKAAWNLFLEKPIIGQGSASFDLLFEKFRPEGLTHQPIWVHNEYLNILSDYGLIGFTCLFIPMFILLKRSVKAILCSFKPFDMGIFLGTLAFGVHSFFDFNCHIPALLFIFLINITMLLQGSSYYSGLKMGLFQYVMPIFCFFLGVYAYSFYQADASYQWAQKKLNYIFQENITQQTSIQAYQDIIGQFTYATQKDTSHANAWSSLSLSSYFAHGVEKDTTNLRILEKNAFEASLKAIQLCPIHWVYWINYGFCLILQNDMQGAGASFQNALNLAPKQSMAWYYYAVYLSLDSSRPDKTLEAVKRALELNASNLLAKNLQEKLLSDCI